MDEQDTTVSSVDTTPSEPETGAENPKDPQEPQYPTETVTAEKMYEVGGRQLTADEIRQEYENLQRDYTRKSQRLAELDRVSDPKDINNTEIPEWKKPDFAPKSWADVIEISKQQAIEELRNQAAAEEQRMRETASLIDQQINEIKQTDPSLDENALFLHANKYGFRDLVAAHSNMQAIKQASVEAEQRTLKNLKARGETPVAGQTGVVVNDGKIDLGNASRFGSAIEYLRSLKGE